jgi:hypothetical protein
MAEGVIVALISLVSSMLTAIIGAAATIWVGKERASPNCALVMIVSAFTALIGLLLGAFFGITIVRQIDGASAGTIPSIQPTQAVPAEPPQSSHTVEAQPQATAVPTSGIDDCNSHPIPYKWLGTDGAIAHNYGFPIDEKSWGATADPNQSSMDVAIAFGPYIVLEPGQYKVVYRIKVSGNETPNTPIIRLNVGAYVNGLHNPNLVNRMISFGEIKNPGTFADYDVKFVLGDCSTDVEFRAFYQNAGDIALESITLTKE